MTWDEIGFSSAIKFCSGHSLLGNKPTTDEISRKRAGVGKSTKISYMKETYDVYTTEKMYELIMPCIVSSAKFSGWVNIFQRVKSWNQGFSDTNKFLFVILLI
jgi:hypothetical protein